MPRFVKFVVKEQTDEQPIAWRPTEPQLKYTYVQYIKLSGQIQARAATFFLPRARGL
jgi:hypothetical protein